jgi:hypothetical protein
MKTFEVKTSDKKKSRKIFVAPELKKHSDLPVITAGSIQVIRIDNPLHQLTFH